jgi:very-short-patch-repair endonuclease
MAAVLASGADAALSHWSAGGEWKTVTTRDEPNIHVMVAGRRLASRPGIVLHRVRAIRRDEITKHDGVPITTPARTLVDLAGCLNSRELERALAETFALRLASRSKVAAIAGRYAGRPGVRRLQDLLDAGSRPALTRSQAEEQFLTLVRKAQIRDPEVNTRIERFEADFLWRAERLVVEIDGRAFHSSNRSFEQDRRRDAVLVGAGYGVMRVTWGQITNEPVAVIARLVRALTSRQ